MLIINDFDIIFSTISEPTLIADMFSLYWFVASCCYGAKVNAGTFVFINLFINVNLHNALLLADSLGLEPRTTKLTNLRTLPCRVSGLAAPMLRKVLELFIRIPYTESLPIL